MRHFGYVDNLDHVVVPLEDGSALVGLPKAPSFDSYVVFGLLGGLFGQENSLRPVFTDAGREQRLHLEDISESPGAKSGHDFKL